MKNYNFWMMVGCILPLFFIFLAPAFGLSGGTTLLIFIIAMFACHLMMPMHHRIKKEQSDTTKTHKHESHQH